MVRDTVLVVGAGASFGARPTYRRPPLGAKLAEYLLGWFDANAPRDGDPSWSFAMSNVFDLEAPPGALFAREPDVRSVLVRAVDLAAKSDTAFEDVMAELLRGQQRALLDRVNELVAAALLGGRACSFREGVDLYDQLFAAVGPRLRGVVTPNYDLLAEEALSRVGLSYRYRAMAGPDDAAVVIDKFHGSANWFQPSGAGRSASFEAARRSAKPLKIEPQTWGPSFFNDHAVYAPPANSRANAIFELKRGGMPLVLVTYGPGKDAMHGRPHLNRVRQECAADLRENPAHRVLAIGISPPRGGGDDDVWESRCASSSRRLVPRSSTGAEISRRGTRCLRTGSLVATGGSTSC